MIGARRRALVAGDAGDDVGHVGFDAGHEGGEIALAALEALQLGLPLAGHGRALDLGVDDGDEANALVRGLERFALANHVLAAEQGLDDLGAGGRGAEAEILHGVGELFSSSVRPACSMAVSKVASV